MSNLQQIISKFTKARILVIGDLILDQYIWGSVDRVSPEAPVPVVWANRRSYVPGGAANVAYNVRSLDGNVILVGVTGKDAHAKMLSRELQKRKITTEGIFTEDKRSTTLKTRVIAGHQQVVRVDWEHTQPLSEKLSDKVLSFIKKKAGSFDALIIEDYGKGVINTRLLDELISLCHRNSKIITVDPKEEHFQYYRGVTSITPNRKELENAVRNLKIKDTANRFRFNSDKLFSDKDIELACREVIEYLGLDSLLVTLGEKGMSLFEKNNTAYHIPTVAQQVFDVSGAGDTVIAAFTLALASGAKKIEAAKIANVAAGIVVGKLGTAVTSREELLQKIKVHN